MIENCIEEGIGLEKPGRKDLVVCDDTTLKYSYRRGTVFFCVSQKVGYIFPVSILSDHAILGRIFSKQAGK
jgi:hypothetical protein